MYELLQRLIIGHNHKWVEYETVRYYSGKSNSETEDQLPSRVVLIRCCEHCGKLKSFEY